MMTIMIMVMVMMVTIIYHVYDDVEHSFVI